MTKAIIFDVDGVLVDSPHEAAWGETLLELVRSDWSGLPQSVRYDPSRYTSGLYQSEVAGKPRWDGARALLRAFGFPTDDRYVGRLAEKKQSRIVELIEEGRFHAYDDAMRFLLRAKAAGIKVAAASSSLNANAMLARVRIEPYLAAAGVELPWANRETSLVEVFDANVCGRTFARGKPAPDIFLAAAEGLGVAPEQCVVVEDAPAGVEAAKAGGMRAIGLARHNDEDLLKAANADWVVTTLDGLDPADF
jgi:beta-phosphoglucomutase-like phosphatase (HAD superfamily)